MALQIMNQPAQEIGPFTIASTVVDAAAYVPDASGALTVAGATDYYRVHPSVRAVSGDRLSAVFSGIVEAIASGTVTCGEACKPAADGKYATGTPGTDYISGVAITTATTGLKFSLLKFA